MKIRTKRAIEILNPDNGLVAPMAELYEAMRMGARALERLRWIPVTERLPDMSKSDWVIGIASGDGMIDAIVMVGYDHEIATWYLSEFPETTVKVSHWMPLPEPPEAAP